MLQPSTQSVALRQRVERFMAHHVYPNERRYSGSANVCGSLGVQPVVEELKAKARADALLNLFFAPSSELSNLDYVPLCEVMGRSLSFHLIEEFAYQQPERPSFL